MPRVLKHKVDPPSARPPSNGNGSGPQVIGAHVVGPAAAWLDQKEDPEHAMWEETRSLVVSIGKRMGVLTDKRTNEPLSAPSTSSDQEDLDRLDLATHEEQTIIPPFDFSVLGRLFENSSSLRQNVDAMVTNVDAFGHRFVPVIDFGSPESNEQVLDLMVFEKITAMAEESEEAFDPFSMSTQELDAITPSIEEVEETKQRWRRIARIEKSKVESFFGFVNPVEPFVEVRKATRESKELFGNGAWEVIREDAGDVTSPICQVYDVPFLNVKLLRTDEKPVEVSMRIRRDPIHFDVVKVERFFRRFVRTTGNRRVYYKDFGDPRTVSRKTGKVYESVEALRTEEDSEAQPAHELFHWKVRSQISPYGVPRWIGTLLSVLGSRAADEVNFLYFDNKAIPPMVLMVSGGRLSEQSVDRIESFIEDRLRGRSNFHKVMVIEALPAGADVSEGDLEHAGKLRLELKPLVADMIQDGLFQEYDQANILKVGRSFRQPQLLTGDMRDANRSTAQVAKAFAEEQVYQPERDAFDAVMDRHFLVNLGVRFWRFKTNAPVQRIPNDLVNNVTKSLRDGAITPNEARPLLEDAFSMDFPHRGEEWGDVPPKLAVAAARQGNFASGEPGMGGDLDAALAEEVTERLDDIEDVDEDDLIEDDDA